MKIPKSEILAAGLLAGIRERLISPDDEWFSFRIREIMNAVREESTTPTRLEDKERE